MAPYKVARFIHERRHLPAEDLSEALAKERARVLVEDKALGQKSVLSNDNIGLIVVKFAVDEAAQTSQHSTGTNPVAGSAVLAALKHPSSVVGDPESLPVAAETPTPVSGFSSPWRKAWNLIKSAGSLIFSLVAGSSQAEESSPLSAPRELSGDAKRFHDAYAERRRGLGFPNSQKGDIGRLMRRLEKLIQNSEVESWPLDKEEVYELCCRHLDRVLAAAAFTPNGAERNIQAPVLRETYRQVVSTNTHKLLAKWTDPADFEHEDALSEGRIGEFHSSLSAHWEKAQSLSEVFRRIETKHQRLVSAAKALHRTEAPEEYATDEKDFEDRLVVNMSKAKPLQRLERALRDGNTAFMRAVKTPPGDQDEMSVLKVFENILDNVSGAYALLGEAHQDYLTVAATRGYFATGFMRRALCEAFAEVGSFDVQRTVDAERLVRRCEDLKRMVESAARRDKELLPAGSLGEEPKKGEFLAEPSLQSAPHTILRSSVNLHLIRTLIPLIILIEQPFRHRHHRCHVAEIRRDNDGIRFLRDLPELRQKSFRDPEIHRFLSAG